MHQLVEEAQRQDRSSICEFRCSNIKHMLKFTKLSWNEVQQSTMISVWHLLWPWVCTQLHWFYLLHLQCLSFHCLTLNLATTGDGCHEVQEAVCAVHQETVTLTRAVGFTEVKEADVSQLLDSKGEELPELQQQWQVHNTSPQPDSPPSSPQLTVPDPNFSLSTNNMAMSTVFVKDLEHSAAVWDLHSNTAYFQDSLTK